MSKIQKGDFPYGHFFKMIGGKWKPYILVAIDYEESIRFNAILKFWGEISSKVLYQNLRELEEDQLIQRFSDPNVKQHVEYRLTEKGKRVMPIIKEIYKYSIDDMIDKDILIDSRAFDYYNPSRKKKEQEACGGKNPEKKTSEASEETSDPGRKRPEKTPAGRIAGSTADNPDDEKSAGAAGRTARTNGKISGRASDGTRKGSPDSRKETEIPAPAPGDCPGVCPEEISGSVQLKGA